MNMGGRKQPVLCEYKTESSKIREAGQGVLTSG